MDGWNGWDVLRGCDICGNDTTGRLCHSCQRQESIDNSDWSPTFCPECFSTLASFSWREGIEEWECDACGHEWIVEEEEKS